MEVVKVSALTKAEEDAPPQEKKEEGGTEND